MTKAKDWQRVAAAVRELAAADQLRRSIHACPSTWTPSAAAQHPHPVRCQLQAGHQGDHRWRQPGTNDVTWWS